VIVCIHCGRECKGNACAHFFEPSNLTDDTWHYVGHYGSDKGEHLVCRNRATAQQIYPKGTRSVGESPVD